MTVSVSGARRPFWLVQLRASRGPRRADVSHPNGSRLVTAPSRELGAVAGFGGQNVAGPARRRRPPVKRDKSQRLFDSLESVSCVALSPRSRYVISDRSGCRGGRGAGSGFLVSGLSVMVSTYPRIRSIAVKPAPEVRLTSAILSLRDLRSRTDRVSLSITSNVSRRVSCVKETSLVA